ncbi:pseudouridine synthase [Shouchella sp. JSM 1781072]|uniref:pseudouridine synthase n=1 Tax=Bacillaceae TaxID=186817 RepID=UPI000C0778D9|nr:MULTISPECIES: pseudouridine synthase [Bacillaceae]UTR05362.1 rRNA pseudouridine synthase [Alkalihalobacillus sp. LMS6]
MRLDKLLANAGYGSRAEVKKILKHGAVHVNGTQVKDPKTQVDPDQDSIQVSGDEVEYKEYVYIMLNKPKNVLSATEDRVHKTVIDLVSAEYGHYPLFPIGRLDLDTEGLILLTNDGQYSHELMSPKKHVGKLYRAEIRGSVTEEDVRAFEQGVTLKDGYTTKPAQLEIKQADEWSIVHVEVSEGKYHQVKRMFEAVGKQVIELERLRIGSLWMDEKLPRGHFRELTSEERLMAKTNQKKDL